MKYFGLHILVFFSGFVLTQRTLYAHHKRLDAESGPAQNNVLGVAFGSPSGYPAFGPAVFSADSITPQVNFSSISVNDKPLGFAADGAFSGWANLPYKTRTDFPQTEKRGLPLMFADSYSAVICAIRGKFPAKQYALAQPLNALEKLELPFNQNTIDFYLTAMPFGIPGKNQFRYQLQGFDRDWVVLGAYNRIRFTRLPHGKYTLRVNASNTAGMWSTSIKELKVIVHPPFWLAWWAYVFYGVAVGLVGRAASMAYKKKLKEKQEAEFKALKAARLQETNEAKARLSPNLLPTEKPNGFANLPENGHHNGFDAKDGLNHQVANGQSPVLLVVVGDHERRAFLRERLSAPWEVHDAANGEEAWALIQRELPEIVICDAMVPGMGGFELCNKSKNDPRTAHINFIMLITSAAQQTIMEGPGAAADQYLTRPFQLYELELKTLSLLQEQDRKGRQLQNKLFPQEPSADVPLVNNIFLDKLHTFLDEHLDDPELDIETVAAAMAMSKSTLNRKLRGMLNIPANEFVKRYKLQKAAAMLSAGCAISEVSYRVGFETPSYFTRCFKAQYHQTPSEFVNAHN